jgi:hypothetical protein
MTEVSDLIAALAAAAKSLEEVKKVARQFIRGQLVNLSNKLNHQSY